MSNIYLALTEQFNRGRFRAIISSGQAAVLHRLAIMSKDGDWILREDNEASSTCSAHWRNSERITVSRALIHQNEQRLARYREAAQRWAANLAGDRTDDPRELVAPSPRNRR